MLPSIRQAPRSFRAVVSQALLDLRLHHHFLSFLLVWNQNFICRYSVLKLFLPALQLLVSKPACFASCFLALKPSDRSFLFAKHLHLGLSKANLLWIVDHFPAVSPSFTHASKHLRWWWPKMSSVIDCFPKQSWDLSMRLNPLSFCVQYPVGSLKILLEM